jgi:hypothetical protein
MPPRGTGRPTFFPAWMVGAIGGSAEPIDNGNLVVNRIPNSCLVSGVTAVTRSREPGDSLPCAG